MPSTVLPLQRWPPARPVNNSNHSPWKSGKAPWADEISLSSLLNIIKGTFCSKFEHFSPNFHVKIWGFKLIARTSASLSVGLLALPESYRCSRASGARGAVTVRTLGFCKGGEFQALDGYGSIAMHRHENELCVSWCIVYIRMYLKKWQVYSTERWF